MMQVSPLRHLALRQNVSPLFSRPMRTFRKNYNPGYYNMRFKPSQGLDGTYFHNVNTFHGAYGPELTKTLVGYTGFCFMMLTHGPFFKLHFFVSALLTAARIRDKGAEPTMDEVWVLDQVFKNEKLRELFSPET